MYLLFFLFGYGSRPPLAKQLPSLPLGAIIVGSGIAIMAMAIVAAYHTDTPLRSLDSNRELPKFVRSGYWFSIVLMTMGLCDILRAILGPGKTRPGR
jgi:hypothetical protein